MNGTIKNVCRIKNVELTKKREKYKVMKLPAHIRRLPRIVRILSPKEQTGTAKLETVEENTSPANPTKTTFAKTKKNV
jgi:hypothetical protein